MPRSLPSTRVVRRTILPRQVKPIIDHWQSACPCVRNLPLVEIFAMLPRFLRQVARKLPNEEGAQRGRFNKVSEQGKSDFTRWSSGLGFIIAAAMPGDTKTSADCAADFVVVSLAPRGFIFLSIGLSLISTCRSHPVSWRSSRIESERLPRSPPSSDRSGPVTI